MLHLFVEMITVSLMSLDDVAVYYAFYAQHRLGDTNNRQCQRPMRATTTNKRVGMLSSAETPA